MKPPQSAATVVAVFLLAAAAGSTAIASRYYAGSMNSRTAIDDLPQQLVDDLSRQRGTNWFDQHYSWSCRIDGVQWAISVHRQGADEAEGYEAGSDGETTYTVDRVKAAAPGSNDSLAVIENGVMPYESSLPVHPVWLTFCAPSLLRFFPGNKMPMLAALGASDSREARMAKYEFRYELEPITSLFFSSFELLNDGLIRETLRDGRFVVIRRDPPHDSGFVMSRLSIPAFNVIGELLSPTEVVYERLKPNSKREETVSLVDRWTLLVTSSYTTNLEPHFWVPNPSAVTDVKDRRFAHSVPPVFSINYRLRSGKWLPREDAFLIKQYESSTGAQSGSARSKGHRRLIVASFIGLTTVAFCFLLWRNRAHLVHS